MLTTQNPSPHGKVENFSSLFEGGTRWKGKLFQAVYRKQPLEGASLHEPLAAQGEDPPWVRWAVIASKKGVDKRATRRNFVKRRLRALVQGIVLPHISPADPRREPVRLEFALIASRRMVSEPWSGLVDEMRAFAAVLTRSSRENAP